MNDGADREKGEFMAAGVTGPDSKRSTAPLKRAGSTTKWYREGLHFSCMQCGNCCGGAPGYVWITKEEIGRVSAFLGRTDGWLDEKHLRRIRLRYSLTEKENGDCVFLERRGDEARCAIYPVRPLQCRTWPFWRENLRSLDAWNEAHTKCPGMNTGRTYHLAEIEALRTQKNW